jgi:hypothetical protein
MYFGTLVTPVHREHETDTWKHDMDAGAPPAQSGRRTFWRTLGRLLRRVVHGAASRT